MCVCRHRFFTEMFQRQKAGTRPSKGLLCREHHNQPKHQLCRIAFCKCKILVCLLDRQRKANVCQCSRLRDAQYFSFGLIWCRPVLVCGDVFVGEHVRRRRRRHACRKVWQAYPHRFSCLGMAGPTTERMDTSGKVNVPAWLVSTLR